MGEPYTLPPVSGPKETIGTLLDTSILGRFQNLDQVRLVFFSFFVFRFFFALEKRPIVRVELAQPSRLVLARRNALIGQKRSSCDSPFAEGERKGGRRLCDGRGEKR